jgi:hypothetical protein
MPPRSRCPLFVCLALALIASGPAGADEPKASAPLERLRNGTYLESGHLKHPLTLADGSKVYSIELHAAGKDKVGITLGLVPSVYNLFGDPLPKAATDAPQPPPLPTRTEATLKPQAQADPAKRGRRLFTIVGEGLGDRLVLVVPGKETDPYRLIARDKSGKVTDVIPLEVQPARIEPCHPGCFPAGTAVATPDGTRPIETIRPGDVVLNVPAAGAPAASKVASVFVGKSLLVEVETEAGRLVTTGKQPLTLADGGTKGAADLTAGDAIQRWQDGKAVSTKVRGVKRLPEPGRVFNLVLEIRGTFIANGYLVHSKQPAE